MDDDEMLYVHNAIVLFTEVLKTLTSALKEANDRAEGLPFEDCDDRGEVEK